MNDFLKNRSELVFLYDIQDGNPNGDPLDENKPRIDEETETNIVTDVRLKRTIRDYLYAIKKEEIFIRELKNKNGELKTKEDRLTELQIKTAEDLISTCIDIRLFGATTAIKKKTITFTGPVQFKFGRSLHKVNLDFIKGTTVMPSKESKKQGTFTETYTLPYSLICFYGIINENTAKKTKLTNKDIKLLIESMWYGTMELTSRSKRGQMPRLLLKINYKEENYHIGDLNKLIELESDISDEKIRDISEIRLNMSALKKKLEDNKEKILNVEYLVDERTTLVGENAAEFNFKKDLAGIKTDEIML